MVHGPCSICELFHKVQATRDVRDIRECTIGAVSVLKYFGRGVSGMRERGAVGHLGRFGAQAVGAEGVTLRRLKTRGREGPQTAQGEEGQRLSIRVGAEHPPYILAETRRARKRVGTKKRTGGQAASGTRPRAGGGEDGNGRGPLGAAAGGGKEKTHTAEGGCAGVRDSGVQGSPGFAALTAWLPCRTFRPQRGRGV